MGAQPAAGWSPQGLPSLGSSRSKHLFCVLFPNVNMAEISHPCCGFSGRGHVPSMTKSAKSGSSSSVPPGRGALMKLPGGTEFLPSLPLLMSVPATSPLNSVAPLSTWAASLDCAERFHCNQPELWLLPFLYTFPPSLVYKSLKRK